ncbi:unnamed protein product [Mesocestoides corti]|uniref:Uncharacterized protein n=1 Tax=Mesocestoides corti TaxID=53468 RepID=A0A0R3URF4_MESCO|nr:unnamed protein product [Mesocestoides corti]
MTSPRLPNSRLYRDCPMKPGLDADWPTASGESRVRLQISKPETTSTTASNEGSFKTPPRVVQNDVCPGAPRKATPSNSNATKVAADGFNSASQNITFDDALAVDVGQKERTPANGSVIVGIPPYASARPALQANAPIVIEMANIHQVMTSITVSAMDLLRPCSRN